MQRSGKGAIRKRILLRKPRWEKTLKVNKKNQVLIPRKHIVSQTSSYFPNRWSLSYLNLTKIVKTMGVLTYLVRMNIRCHRDRHEPIKNIKVHVRNEQDYAQSERDSQSKNRGRKKIN